MRPLGAGVLAAAIQGCAEEVRGWIQARSVDVVVLGEITHGA